MSLPILLHLCWSTTFSHSMHRSREPYFGPLQASITNEIMYWTYPCDKTPAMNMAFCDASLSFDERVQNLLDTFTLNETLSETSNWAGPIPRLNITWFNWWFDAAHGLSQNVDWNRFPTHSATAFPQTIGSGASFNRSLWFKIGDVISTEARAFWNYNATGLTLWDPNINIYRDPRWGRGQETPGEDPFVNAEYGINFVQGMQGNETENAYLKVSVTCKHFDAYSFDNYDNVDRHHFNAIVNGYDMNDTYLVPFKYCVGRDQRHGQGSGVMCSYNEINGVPGCANKALLTDILRNEWKFDGYIVSDCQAVKFIYTAQQYAPNAGETIAAVYAAGMNMECWNFIALNGYQAVMDGYVTLLQIKNALFDAFRVLMRLGYFDDPKKMPWSDYGPQNVNTAYNQQVALDAARQGTVLLKNAKNALPILLDVDDIESIAVLGPNANNSNVMLGDYGGVAPFITTVLNAIESYTVPRNITAYYNQGCDVNSMNTSNFSIASQLAKQSDVVILAMGLDQSIESEGRDRVNLTLPGVQNEFITSIAAVAKKVILVLVTGGCVDVEQFEMDDNVHAILYPCSYGGMYGGQGVADVIFGEFAPTGLVSQTWYKQAFADEASMFDMGMRPVDAANNAYNNFSSNPGRGYRYYSGDSVLYPFGYGLSYTQWQCGIISNVEQNRAKVNVMNVGAMDSGGVVLVFFVPKNAGKNGVPLKRLVAFDRFDMIRIGENSTIEMNLYEEFLWSDEYNNFDGAYVLGGICK